MARLSEPESAAPLPFAPSVASARWSPSDGCLGPGEDLWLVTGFEEGACGAGGTRLQVAFLEEQLGGAIAPGTLPVSFTDVLRVQFVREDADGGRARWCNEAAGSFGSLVLEEVSVDAGGRLLWEIDAVLERCEGPAGSPIRVQARLALAWGASGFPPPVCGTSP